MNRTIATTLLMAVTVSMLSACQVRRTQQNVANTVQISCSGAESCEFSRLNDVLIINEKNHKATRDALGRGWIQQRKADDAKKAQNSIYLTVPPQQYEVVVRFYPISQQHAEVFHVIHDFKPHQQYTFKMFRQRPVRGTGSLLNVSAPSPLCVDLIRDQKTIRRFCRPYEVMTGLSEYVEQKL